MDTSRNIPFKDLSKGEKYTEDEVKFLKERWSTNDTKATAEWIDRGVNDKNAPDCIREQGRAYRQREYDLRGIDLQDYLQNPRNKTSPKIQLTKAHLEYANLSNTHLEYSDMHFAHFEYVKLSCSHLEHSDLWKASFYHAYLDSIHLRTCTSQSCHP